MLPFDEALAWSTRRSGPGSGDGRAENPFEAVVKDVERYNAAQLHQLGLLRFAWEHAMLRQDYVRETFRSWLATVDRQFALTEREVSPAERGSMAASRELPVHRCATRPCAPERRGAGWWL